jgi:hypothetical protein
VKFERLVIKNDDPWQVSHSLPTEKINLLELFPDARQTDNEGRYYLAHCPIHGNHWNFWLDTKFNICGCYGGCQGSGKDGSFLATELYRMLGE